MKPLFEKTAICFLLTLSMAVLAQPKYGIKWSGYVKNDVFLDTRQVTGAREGHVLLYPKAELPDSNGTDINASPSLGMMAVQTRLHADFSGPDVLGASLTGAVEAEFFGISESDINGVRLRHAYGKLVWPQSELLVGQYWHPFFPVNAAPNTVSFNTGIVFIPFARNPQIRYSYHMGIFRLTGAILAERDMVSNGPNGLSTEYQRNSALPISTLMLDVVGDSGRIVFGIGSEYHELRPQLVTAANFETNERVRSLSHTAYFKIERKSFSWKLQGALYSNATHFTTFGGYAAYEIDSATMVRKYTPVQTAAGWTDLQINFGKLSIGALAGYAKNLGASKELLPKSYYSRDANMDYVYRVSPRVTYKVEKLTLGLELEYTAAAYGVNDSKGKVENSKEVANLRTLLAVFFNF